MSFCSSLTLDRFEHKINCFRFSAGSSTKYQISCLFNIHYYQMLTKGTHTTIKLDTLYACHNTCAICYNVLQYPCFRFILHFVYIYHIYSKRKPFLHTKPKLTNDSARLVISSILKSSLLFKGWLFTSRKKDIRYNGILCGKYVSDIEVFNVHLKIIIFYFHGMPSPLIRWNWYF